MVFYIDYSIHEVLATRELLEDEVIYFSNLASMFYSGECYLCGNVDSLDDLSQRLEYPFKNIYCKIKDHYAESGAVMKIVQTVLVLGFKEKFQPQKLPNILQTRDKACFISISIAKKWSQVKRCCLLSENLDDCAFYERIAAYYCAKHRIQGLQISFYHENGGGNTTCNVLRKCVQSEKIPTLCIVDSDRRYGISKEYPDQPNKGSTCLHAEEVSKELNNYKDIPPHGFYSLDIHEVENLIPMQVLREIAKQKHPTMNAGLDVLNKLINVNSESILYYDFKKGFPYLESPQQRSYWQGIILMLGGSEKDMPPSEKPTASNGQTRPFFPPVSCKGLLQQATKILDVSDFEFLHLDEYLESFWEHIGIIMLTWGCASLPSSA